MEVIKVATQFQVVQFALYYVQLPLLIIQHYNDIINWPYFSRDKPSALKTYR